jgi:16S rRNA (uracil1498-N3)-methyltransferase
MTVSANAIRLYVDTPLSDNHLFELTPRQSHYVLNVMRTSIGDPILVFNGVDGEFLARLEQVQKRTATLRAVNQTRAQVEDAPLHLYFAPLKGERLGLLVEKAVELGVTDFHPIFTQHTVPSHINLDRLDLRVIEAAEQCERLTLPELHDPCSFEEFLTSWNSKDPLYFCEERAISPYLLDAMQKKPGGNSFLIGPEGGFSTQEKEMLHNESFVTSVSLGDRVFRSETAALVALSLFSAHRESLKTKESSKAA